MDACGERVSHIVLALAVLAGMGNVVASDSGERAKSAEREQLRRARVELARQRDRIGQLEEELRRRGIEIPEERHIPPEEGRSLAESITRLRKLDERLSGNGSERVASSHSPENDGQETSTARGVSAGATITIEFDQGTSVNEEGRDRVLRFVEQTLERSPRAVFRVEGGADDTEFIASDEAIADNRARFLVSYLVYRGIPEDAFLQIEGKSTKEQDEPRRFARLSVVSDRPGTTDMAGAAASRN